MLLEVNRVPVVAVLPLVSAGLHVTLHLLASDQGNGKRAVVLAFSEVRRVVERVCARQDVLDACARRDLGYVIAVLEEKNGLTQGQMASLTGLHQNRLSDYKTGKHKPKEYSVFAAFADGLGLPSAARRALGLDATEVEWLGSVSA
jgi:Helix-turn-helix domain